MLSLVKSLRLGTAMMRLCLNPRTVGTLACRGGVLECVGEPLSFRATSWIGEIGTPPKKGCEKPVGSDFIRSAWWELYDFRLEELRWLL